MTIELCINTEWLANNWLSGECQEGWDDEVAAEAVQAAGCHLLDCGLEYEHAQGQRMLYHGWHGARFDDRVGPFGVWGKLTADQEAVLWAASEAGVAAAREASERIEAQNIAD